MPTLEQTCRLTRPAALVALLSLTWAATFVGVVQGEPKASTVRLVVDYGDGVEVHFTALPWREDMTVLNALSAAQAHRHGMSFTQRGAGASAMITKIGDVKNEGDGRNWLYYVNEKQGEVSAGVMKLKPGDAVLWRFETYDYNQ
jgi:hypothetical protein